jgi:hypothetical protein
MIDGKKRSKSKISLQCHLNVGICWQISLYVDIHKKNRYFCSNLFTVLQIRNMYSEYLVIQGVGQKYDLAGFLDSQFRHPIPIKGIQERGTIKKTVLQSVMWSVRLLPDWQI